MTWQDPNLVGDQPQELPPFALAYGNRGATRPGVITPTGVIGIIIAALGLFTALYETIYAVSFAMMGKAMPAGLQWQTSATETVRLSAAGVGAVLAIVLLIGSIGLLRLRPSSRRVLLWWAGLYLLSVVVFLVLEILVIVPAQAAMFTNVIKTMPQPVPFAAGSAAGAAPTTAASAYSVTTTTINGTTTTVVHANATAGGPPTAQMAAMMRMAYVFMAFFKAVVCLIFPIAMLIVLHLRSVRAALAPPVAG
jgi:hypothetical protein